MENKIIVIAGGTGLIGKELHKKLKDEGFNVRILTRNKSAVLPFFYWDPKRKEIDSSALKDTHTIVNLSGVSIFGKRWSNNRKREILSSRIETTRFLYEKSKEVTSLKNYVSASGITCYGYENSDKQYSENDDFGHDFLSQVVEQWEKSADLFSDKCKVAKIRTGVVLTEKGGALALISKTIRANIGAVLGTGKQIMPWITLKDITEIYFYVITNELCGAYNAATSEISNEQLTKAVAEKLKKPLWLPKVPSFVMRFILGEMSSLILKGVRIDNNKIKDTGFKFNHPDIDVALGYIYDEKEKTDLQ